jgi:hypothetical protein
MIWRRALLVGTLVGAGAACARPSARPSVVATATALPGDFDRWNQEARGILSDALASLRTYDDFQAFRVSTAPESSRRLAAELTWDPPISAAWDEATHVARGARGRAEQLFQAITMARIDPTLWREQRTLADAAHDLLDLADALGAYADRLGPMSPGDASSALGLLDTAWGRWDASAARWGISRAETISCANSENS